MSGKSGKSDKRDKGGTSDKSARSPDSAESASPWYQDGLQFTCTQCGNCCGGAPGFVWVSEDEIAALAERLGLSEASFRRRYTETVYRRGVSLIEKADSHDCIFYDREKGCTVYEDRPQQCRTWPFWRSLIRDRDSWQSAAADCPGMNQGVLHSQEHIESTAADDGLP